MLFIHLLRLQQSATILLHGSDLNSCVLACCFPVLDNWQSVEETQVRGVSAPRGSAGQLSMSAYFRVDPNSISTFTI
jgi:hypothetical protein